MKKSTKKSVVMPRSAESNVREDTALDEEDVGLLDRLKDAHQAISRLKESVSHRKIALDIARRIREKK